MDKRKVTIVFITKGVFENTRDDRDLKYFIQDSLPGHYSGNRGVLDLSDSREKEFFQANQDRLLSVFRYRQLKIFMITEADLSSTVVLLSTEYVKSISLSVFMTEVRQG